MSNGRWALLLAVAVLMAGGGLFLISQGSDNDDPVDTAAGAAFEALPAPTVSGEALPQFPGNSAADPAVGRSIPVVTGVDLDGEAITLGATGGPQAILFLAHWCPHCQDEVPEVQQLIDSGGLPTGTSISAVTTAYAPDRGNWPPDVWLDSESWSAPTISDGGNSISEAYGLAGFPYWVFVDGDGTVVGRVGGQLGADNVAAALAAIS